jgi:alpha-galactosidase
MKKLAGICLLWFAVEITSAQFASPDTNLTVREEQIIAASKLGGEVKVVHANKLAFTPPMGWNSYDIFGDSVVESEVLSNADWMHAHLQPFGWRYIVIDFRWYDPKPTGDDRLLNPTRTGAALTADKFGRLLPAPNRFPSAADGLGFKPLADRLHAKGLKFGIHVMRGVPRQAVLAGTKIFDSNFTAADAGDPNDKCPWCPDMFGARDNAAGRAWYDSCAKLWASWGVDYIKVDDLSQPYHTAEIEMIRRALEQFAPNIVFSTSPGPTPTSRAGHIAAHANLWRISGDFWDRWPKLDEQFDLLAQWQGAGGPGHWPDADMIPLGHIAIRSKLGGNSHWTHFTRDEQLTLMSLWALAPSPLMLGMNLPDNDAWTTALLTNPEVLSVDQDPLGKPVRRVFSPGQSAEVWVKKLSGGALAVGFFNRTDEAVKVNLAWSRLGLSTAINTREPWHGATTLVSRPSAPRVRDLWLRKNLGRQKNFIGDLPPHGCVLLRVK